MLEIENIAAGYGRSQVLADMALHVREGEAVTMMGRNGMGKTTTVLSIMGLLKPTRGRILFCGKDITGAHPYQVARAGIGLVPEGRRITPNLTVEENLIATARKGEWSLQRVYALFPRLLERRGNMGNQLSGGEQQMLAVGRALITQPKLLILDEATEGLAPLIRNEIWHCLDEIKGHGQAILVIDKDAQALARFADRHYLIEKGGVVWSGTSAALRDSQELCARYLGVE